MDMRGGDPVPVTKAPLGVQQFAWRPDGAALAYVASDEAPNKKDIDAHRDGFVVGDQAFNDMAAPTIARIWTVAADGTGAKQLTSGTFSLPSAQPPSSPGAPISWSPDGREIVFTQMPNAYDADSDLAVVAILDVQTGTVRALTTHGKYEGFGEFSPDGKNVSYWYPFAGDPAAQNDIFVAPAAGGNGADITATEIDSNVQRAIWMNDGTLLIAGHKGTDAALWIKPLGAPARQLDLAGVQPAQTFWLDAGVSRTGAIAFAGTEANHPSELYYLASDTAKPRRLTSYNQATADLNLGKVVPVTWTFEGYNEDGVLTYPPNYDASKTYPLVLVIHGGPNSSSTTGFNFLNQVMAARGYLVFNPNYRGSDNLGEKYWHAIVADAGAGPGRDVMAGIEAVNKIAKIDPKRVAVSGWSYGGYMTSWLEGHYHDWKVAVAGAAVNNLVDEYALADNGVGDATRSAARLGRITSCRICRPIAANVRSHDRNADAHHERHRRPARSRHTIVRNVPHAKRPRHIGGILGVSGRRALPKRSGSQSRTSIRAGPTGSLNICRRGRLRWEVGVARHGSIRPF